MARMSLEFDGMEQMMRRLQAAGGGVGDAAERALEDTHRAVTARVEKAQASSRYNVDPGITGATAGSVHRDPTVEWSGDVASVPVGWSISNGGLASVFLMYGTPRIEPDRGLYNAVFGAATRRAAREAQADAIAEFMSEVM